MPHSQRNHTLDWMVTVLLLCSSVKPEIYKDRYASLTVVNNFLRWKSYFHNCLLTLFYICLLLVLSIFLVRRSLKAQHNERLRIEFKHLVIHPNQQSDTNCDIIILVANTPWSRLNHMLEWLVTVMLWCNNIKLIT